MKVRIYCDSLFPYFCMYEIAKYEEEEFGGIDDFEVEEEFFARYEKHMEQFQEFQRELEDIISKRKGEG